MINWKIAILYFNTTTMIQVPEYILIMTNACFQRNSDYKIMQIIVLTSTITQRVLHDAVEGSTLTYSKVDLARR
jgi:hypothetical protein